tara:strand:- start:150 stop:401 length:252 start_codon:yes stop_codon:yes gene_type:complete
MIKSDSTIYGVESRLNEKIWESDAAVWVFSNLENWSFFVDFIALKSAEEACRLSTTAVLERVRIPLLSSVRVCTGDKSDDLIY